MAEQQKTAPQERPGFVLQKDVASMLDITTRWTQELTKRGILKKYRLPVGERYNLVECVKDYVRYLNKLAEDRARAQAPSANEARKISADADMMETRARRAKIELQDMESKFHNAEDVEDMTNDLIYTIGAEVMAMSGKLGPDAAKVNTAPEASILIERECHAMLHRLARYQYNPERIKRQKPEVWQAINEKTGTR